MMDRHPSEHDAHSRSESSSDQTTMIATADDGSKVGLAPVAQYCKAYWPGHSIHAIHARHGAESKDWVPARILSIEGNFIEFETESGTWRRWNHNAAQLRRIGEVPELLPDAEASWCEQFWLLMVEVDGIGHLLSLAESGDRACIFR